MYLFFDTETTGKPLRYDAPASDTSNWPRVVQLAYLCAEANGKITDKGNFIIRPDGFTIPKEAAAIHGITTERALREGRDLKEVLNTFARCLQSAKYLVPFQLLILGYISCNLLTNHSILP